MTDSRAPAEPYTTAFESTVDRVDGREVVLETTYFYAEGGGQPPDRGTIAGVEVVDVQKGDDGVRHTLAEPPDVEAGDTVAAEIDPAFRTYCMRAHTASHVLYGAGRRLFDDLGYGGFGITEEKVRIDFSTTESVDDDTLAELERLANRAVWDSREVRWREVPEADARGIDGIAFNTKTEEGVMAEADRIRVVEVDGWDVAACGGTHVANTREIGPVTVLGRSNPGEGLVRVELAVGPPGIERRIAEKRAALGAGSVLDANVGSLVEAARGLRERNEDLQAEVAALEDRLVEAQLGDLREDVRERDGERWLVGTLEGVDANGLGERAKALAREDVDVAVLVGEDGRTAIAAAAFEAETDAGGIVDAVTTELGGGGGGSPAFAQGGGIGADPDEVVAFLETEGGEGR